MLSVQEVRRKPGNARFRRESHSISLHWSVSVIIPQLTTPYPSMLRLTISHVGYLTHTLFGLLGIRIKDLFKFPGYVAMGLLRKVNKDSFGEVFLTMGKSYTRPASPHRLVQHGAPVRDQQEGP